MNLPSHGDGSHLFRSIVHQLGLGIFVVDAERRVLFWNHFLEVRSGLPARDVLGKDLCEIYPELSRRFFERHLRTVFGLGTCSFSSWTERPFLLRLPHDRPISGGVDCMRQDCTFMPVRGEAGEVAAVCVTLQDVTDACIAQGQLEKATAALEQASLRDALTGVFNRRYLDAQLTQHVARARRHGTKLSAILLDIDHFKRVNDTHGHAAGDQVLRITAERLVAIVRASDVFARYGGEEFVVLLPDTPIEGAQVAAEHLRAAVAAAPVAFEELAITVTISLGVAELTPAVSSPPDLVARADEALYRAKQGGRNRVSVAAA